MKELEKGQYSGNKMLEVKNKLFTTSITAYSADSFDNTRHSHPNSHLSFVLKGGCEEQKNEKYQRKLLSSTFYHMYEPHQINIIPKNAIHLNIDFEPLFLKEINSELNIELTAKYDFSLPFEMVKLYNELNVNDNLKTIGIEEKVLSLFSKSKSGYSYEGTPVWVKQIKQYIQEYWDQSITLDELALITGLHKVSISKHFSKYTGCSITTYQRKIRVYKSLELINSNKYSLTEIAISCGFSDQSHFIKFFKQYTNILPKKYQQL